MTNNNNPPGEQASLKDLHGALPAEGSGMLGRRRLVNWLQNHPWMAALLVLIAGLVLAGVAARWQDVSNKRYASAKFDSLTASAVAQLQRRMAVYAQELRGTSAMISSVGMEALTREQFKRYVSMRRIDQEFPNAVAMAILSRVPQSQDAAYLAAARRDGAPQYMYRELGPRVLDERHVIRYSEPLEQNLRAIGADFASEIYRRTATQTSMRTGRVTMSAFMPFVLIEKPRYGSTMLLPVYTSGMPLDNVEQREAATAGWVCLPVLVDQDIQTIASAEGYYHLAVSDITEAPGQSIYASPVAEGDARPVVADSLLRVHDVPMLERRWQARFEATPLFISDLHLPNPRVVFGVVAALGGLSALMVLLGLQSSARQRQVRVETARRAAVVDASSDAIIGETLDGIVTDWNRSAELMFGYSAAQAQGYPLAQLLLPPDREHEERHIRDIARSGIPVPPFDSERLRADGSVIEVSIAAFPILAPDGRCTGLSKSVRDISQARRAERMARQAEALANELNARLEAQVAERTALLETARHRLETILDAMPSQIGYWDCDLVNQMANKAHHDWFDVDPAQLPGTHMRDVIGPELFARGLPYMEIALAGQAQNYLCMNQAVLPSGELRHASVNYIPDVIDGKVRGLYTLVHDVTDMIEARVKLDAAVRENEVLLRTIHTHAIVSVTDANGVITEVNDNFCNVSGYSRDELLGRNHNRVASGQHSQAEYEAMWRVISAGQLWRGEMCNRTKSGVLYWVDNMIAPFFDQDGHIEKYISICNDITERKRSEADLRQSNHRFALASEAAGIGFWDQDLESGLVHWDAGMYRIYHCEPMDTEALQHQWYQSLHPEDLPRCRALWERCMAEGLDYEDEYRVVLPDGVERHMKSVGRIHSGEQGRAKWLYGVDFDITDRKLSEMALQATSSLLQSVLDSATEVAVIAVAPAGEITVFNAGAQRMLGYAPNEVIGCGRTMQFHDRAEMWSRTEDMSKRLGREIDPEYLLREPELLGQPDDWTFVRKDGSRITVNLTVTAMTSPDGQLFGYLGAATDVTQQKQVEQKLREAMHKAKKANQAKSLFLANMSHEIRTPMNAVMGLSYLLGQTPLDEEQSALLGKIRSASKSLLAVINDVLDLSKIEAGELKIDATPFSPRSLLGDLAGLVTMQAQDKDIAFEITATEDLPLALVGDAARLNQVLINLLNNAVKFTDHGGVKLLVHCVKNEPDQVRLRFTVQDSGIGIPADVQEKLFAPFVQADTSTTRRFGGTGLGLSIVKHLVSLMGGTVSVDSRACVGSEFSVELDFGVASPEALGAVLAEAHAPELNGLLGVRVLVIDDSEINLEVAKRILQRQGAQVTLASNGQEAVERLRHQADSFDLLLMDVQMPVMDGYEATLYIRQQLGLRYLPIIALTAGALTSEQQRASAVGMDDFISKPFDVNSLVRCIRRHVQPRLMGAASASPARAAMPEVDWPKISGIDSQDAAKRLGGDLHLFQAMLKRMLEEFGDLDLGSLKDALVGPEKREEFASLMHKLKGCAGLLGARDLYQMASGAEIACRINDAKRAQDMVAGVMEQLDRLRESAGPELAQRLAADEARLEAEARSADPLDPDRLHVLTTLLRQQNLGALEQFNAMAPQLRQRLDRETFLRMRELLDGLRFAEVADTLERLCGGREAAS